METPDVGAKGVWVDLGRRDSPTTDHLWWVAAPGPARLTPKGQHISVARLRDFVEA